MALPKIDVPKFVVEIPSTKQKVTVRPFLVKEQKALVIASETGKVMDLFESMCDMVEACTFGAVDARKIPIVDLEWLFLKIRGKSIGEQVELSFRCQNVVGGSKCNTKIAVQLNLDAVEYGEFPKTFFMLNDRVGVQLRSPTAKEMVEVVESGSSPLELLYLCTELVVDGEDSYSEFSRDELVDFYENLMPDKAREIEQFFTDQPSIKAKLNIKCPKCGNSDVVEVKGLNNFFG